MKAPLTTTILGPDQGEDVWFLDNLLTIKARPAAGMQFGVLENAMPAGSHTPLHRHDCEDEAFYVLEGTMRFFIDGRAPIDVGPGSYLHIRKGTPHGFVTLTPVRTLVLCGGEGFVEMAREAGGPAARHELPPVGPPDLPRLEAACARHQITLLGPLPE
jgi:quercetin dioxygenase-like cupin family protein